MYHRRRDGMGGNILFLFSVYCLSHASSGGSLFSLLSFCTDFLQPLPLSCRLDLILILILRFLFHSHSSSHFPISLAFSRIGIAKQITAITRGWKDKESRQRSGDSTVLLPLREGTMDNHNSLTTGDAREGEFRFARERGFDAYAVFWFLVLDFLLLSLCT